MILACGWYARQKQHCEEKLTSNIPRRRGRELTPIRPQSSRTAPSMCLRRASDLPTVLVDRQRPWTKVEQYRTCGGKGSITQNWLDHLPTCCKWPWPGNSLLTSGSLDWGIHTSTTGTRESRCTELSVISLRCVCTRSCEEKYGLSLHVQHHSMLFCSMSLPSSHMV